MEGDCRLRAVPQLEGGNLKGKGDPREAGLRY